MAFLVLKFDVECLQRYQLCTFSLRFPPSLLILGPELFENEAYFTWSLRIIFIPFFFKASIKLRKWFALDVSCGTAQAARYLKILLDFKRMFEYTIF